MNDMTRHHQNVVRQPPVELHLQVIPSLVSLDSVCEQGQLNCTQERCKEVNQCPGSLIYSPRSCLLTCASLDSPDKQQGSGLAQPGCREPLSGCVCPQGTVLMVTSSFLY